MEQQLYILLSFISGVIFANLFTKIMRLGNSAIAVKATIKDCLQIMSINIQSAIEAYDIKYHALEIADKDPKYIEFQRRIDKQQLRTLQKTIIRNFIVSIPPRYEYLLKFDDWDSAMSYLSKELKRRQS